MAQKNKKKASFVSKLLTSKLLLINEWSQRTIYKQVHESIYLQILNQLRMFIIIIMFLLNVIYCACRRIRKDDMGRHP